MDNKKQWAPVVVRIGISLVYLWFGTSQIMDPTMWISWLPDYTESFPVSAKTLVLLNGIFEVVAAIFLLLGAYTRIAAGLLALHAIHIVFTVGYGPIGVRDFGIMASVISVFLNGPDKLCLDQKLRKPKEIEVKVLL